MLAHLILLLVITAASWAVVFPMLREPRFDLAAPELPVLDVPNTTFDPRGFA